MSTEAYGYSSWQKRTRDPGLIALLAVERMTLIAKSPLHDALQFGAEPPFEPTGNTAVWRNRVIIQLST